ncbi:MAG: hypothetical protein AAF939_19605, partial [Planctomycetota bacterium]
MTDLLRFSRFNAFYCCKKMAVIFLLAWGVLAGSVSGDYSDASADLYQSVLKLNSILNQSPQSEAWRRTLKLNVLETQAALGSQADIETLSRLQFGFSRSQAGNIHPAFAEVEKALGNQIRNLSNGQNLDPLALLEKAKSEYRPITLSKLSSERDAAAYEMGVLQRYYQSSLPMSDQDQGPIDIEFDSIITFLIGLKFELPPEFSVGKMDSMLRDVRAQLQEVIAKIDALPFEESEPEAADQDEQDESPKPDDEVDERSELEAERKRLQEKFDALRKQRSEYLKLDAPRLKERQRVFTELRKIEAKLAETAKQKGDPFFVATRMAIEKLNRIYFFGTSDNLQEDYLRKLDQLQSLLNNENEADRTGKIGDTLRWLEGANQAPALITAVRSKMSLPNLYISVSSGFINSVASRPVYEVQQINRTVEGRPTTGTATLSGSVTIDLVDDPNQVHASLYLNGNIDSQTQFRVRKLCGYVDADGRAEARQSVYANVGGFYVNEPYAAADIHTFFLGTSSNCGLINKVAAKKFAEVQPKTEAKTSNETSDQIRDQFSEQTGQPLTSGRQQLAEAQQKLLSRSDLLPQIYLRSTSQEIIAVGKKITPETLGAPDRPSSDVKSDVSVQLHDSFLTNFVYRTFSNRTFSEDELAEEIKSLLGDTEEAIEGGEFEEGEGEKPEEEKFGITFAQINPVEFEFENNRFSIIASGRRFTQGKRRINEGLKIILRFKMIRQNGVLKFVRDGNAEIDYLDKSKKSPSTV